MFESELLIVDWRSPIASMFYDYELGPSKYKAPMGVIKGELVRKRQFKIEKGKLKYVLESSLNIQDNILQQVLSQTSDDKMKSIISTIQKEQNQIIRNEKSKSIIIQGVAGSGKTSIALHRISFLLYRFKDRLLAKNIAIISPNKVFGDYISTVLPELGDEPINELSLVEMAKTQLSGVLNFELDKDPLEMKDVHWANRAKLKSTLSFVNKINTYLQEKSCDILDVQSYTFKEHSASADYIQERFIAYRSTPFKKRLQLISNDIYHNFTTNDRTGDKIPRPNMILKSLNKMLKIKNTITLYKDFYSWLNQPEMFTLPEKQTLEWADVYPFLYFHAAFEGLQEHTVIQHLVIDEMQDYTPIQYAVINRLYVCQKTILGDFNQRVNPNHQYTMQDMLTLYPEANVVELIKSYRSTYEIITFANIIQQISNLEPIERHGEIPQIVACDNELEKLLRMKEMLESFLHSEYVSLGIILKTNTLAHDFHDLISQEYDVNLISPESTHFTNGISITSVSMSKGLEFDEVIILDVDNANYDTIYDKSLLYIAVTRAMHKLTILYSGEKSHLLP